MLGIKPSIEVFDWQLCLATSAILGYKNRLVIF